MTKRKNLLILSIIFIIFSIFFYGKTGNVFIDFSRESYIPFQLNNGDQFFKDIFLIYGPFGYLINSLLYKISINLNLLFLEAHLISYGILILFYLILNKFVSHGVSLFFSIFLITISIFSDTTFTFTTPYSFSTLWAYFGIYACLFALLYNKKNILFLSLGLILSNKIELFIPIFILSMGYLIYKKEKFIKNSLFLLIFPLMSYSVLFINNCNIDLITKNLNYISKMTQTGSISVLYEGVGSFFELEYFKYNLFNLLKVLVICGLSYFSYIKNKKILSCLILILGFSFLHLEFSLNLSGLALILLTTYLLICKKIKSEELLLIIFSLALCSKSIFAVNSLSYSNFGYIILLFALYLKLKEIINEKWLQNAFLTFFILLFCSKLVIIKYDFKTKVKTPIGSFYLQKYKAELINKLNEFIEKNIKKEETFIVVPEGQIINLIHKKKHDFYNSTFTPLDFETFGEQNLAQKLKENKTDYVIFLPRDTSDYGAKLICYDYAVDFCKIVMDNYTKIKTFGENSEQVYIYKIKKK